MLIFKLVQLNSNKKVAKILVDPKADRWFYASENGISVIWKSSADQVSELRWITANFNFMKWFSSEKYSILQSYPTDDYIELEI